MKLTAVETRRSRRSPGAAPAPLGVCFVTGSRAEFGLMHSALRAIAANPRLQLQLVVTGMHLDRRLGHSIDAIRDGGWKIDGVVPWPASPTPTRLAQSTGRAIARLAGEFERLKTDVVLIVGDRVEAFAAASAAHLGGRIVAHVHGGDRALGQVDDALRHAITKLAHVHFPATRRSAERIARLGEDSWRIHRVGSPGLDEIGRMVGRRSTAGGSGGHALLVLHPADAGDELEYRRASMILQAVESVEFRRIVVVYPNNDPGADGIIRRWNEVSSARKSPRLTFLANAPRPRYLRLLREAAVLVGNSSSGIIEAASFKTPVIDIGPRQRGREHGANVVHVGYSRAALVGALKHIWNDGRPRRFGGPNIYGTAGAGRRIADILGRLEIDDKLRRKLISH